MVVFFCMRWGGNKTVSKLDTAIDKFNHRPGEFAGVAARLQPQDALLLPPGWLFKHFVSQGIDWVVCVADNCCCVPLYTQIGKKTLCVGLSTTHFRSARYSSHEVYIPKSQTMWLEELLNKHPEEEGWRGACVGVFGGFWVFWGGFGFRCSSFRFTPLLVAPTTPSPGVHARAAHGVRHPSGPERAYQGIDRSFNAQADDRLLVGFNVRRC